MALPSEAWRTLPAAHDKHLKSVRRTAATRVPPRFNTPRTKRLERDDKARFEGAPNLDCT